ncbi:dihydrodipicolinate synthase family protein [Saccharopolyspora sp. ASAGF58]|uniref:dihydrodipicolinate synthase family protein n=1 Tax=Saccharopolyspora sp. ASAGF58 TaxID=2719023 RepID=UPI001440150E|nr:dihydrodipicolinate synthase family protein [Saccharopolyspora sp. ASAGF58]QIZ37800.1 dihydrodipicolinate synthase family protein [Saccharopolyspora sp. ASAGF58]
MGKSVGGVLAAVSTPFGEDGAVDEKTLRDHVDYLIANGVHGLVPCGSTGEFAALTSDERKRVAEVVIEQAAGRVAVVPHTGSTRTAEAVALTQHAERHGADAVLVVQPFYEAPTRTEVIEYFATIGSETSLPLVAYNLPSVTGMNLDANFYEDLLECTSSVQYIKDTSGDLDQVYELLFRFEGRIGILVGWDTIVLPAFAAGATGSIWGAPNFMPRECVDLFELTRAGKHDEAQKLWRQVWFVQQFLGAEGYAVSTKAAAELRGRSLGAPRAPYSRLPEDKLKQLRGLLDEAGLLSA